MKRGNTWYLFTRDRNRYGSVYSSENITLYWNGCYCVHQGSYYYVADTNGHLISGTYSSNPPELLNSGNYRVYRNDRTYMVTPDGRIY